MSPLAVIFTFLSLPNRLFTSRSADSSGCSPCAEQTISLLQFRLKDSIEAARALELADPNIATAQPLADLIALVGEVQGQLERLQISVELLNPERTSQRNPARTISRSKSPRRAHTLSPEQRIALRLLHEGLAVEQVARKTMLPIEVVKRLGAQGNGKVDVGEEAALTQAPAIDIVRSQVLL